MYPLTTFRAFKRHYHKIRKIAEELFNKGSFNLNISIGEQKLKAEFETPDHDATIRFIVLMRRFLNPADLLFYQKIWSLLLDEFTNEIPGETVQQVNALISQLKKGDIGININGEDLTPEKIYQTIANGDYFNRDKDAQIYLQSVSGVPIFGPVFWQQFHAYTLAGYGVASALFSVILKIEKSQKYQEFLCFITPEEKPVYILLDNQCMLYFRRAYFPKVIGK